MIIRHHVSELLLDKKLINLRCKHAVRGTSERADKVIGYSSEIGYSIAEWGLNSGHLDILCHADVVMKMERDGFEHPERIVICKYDFQETPCIWLDNMHSAIMYVRKYGMDVRLKNIPFYVVDLSEDEPVLADNKTGIIIPEKGNGAIEVARKRFYRSDSRKLIELHYTLADLLADNPVLLSCTEPFGTDCANRGAKKRLDPDEPLH